MASYYGQQQQQGGYAYPQQGYQPQGANPYYPQQQQPGWNVPPPQQPQGGYAAENAETGGIPKRELGFNDALIRAQFVRKVFFTVAIMLGIVALMSAFPFIHEGTMQFVRGNFWLYLLGYVTFFVVYIALMCCEGVRRSYPTNIILLGILTLAIGFMTMMITAYHSVSSVFMALAITSISCGGVALFATVTKKDLTSMMGFMFIATMCLSLFGLGIIIVGMFTNLRIVYVVYAAIGAFLFMIWLAIDIQMVMGGKTYELSPEEHIFASITIFLDIIQIFWFLLMIFGDRDS